MNLREKKKKRKKLKDRKTIWRSVICGMGVYLDTSMFDRSLHALNIHIEMVVSIQGYHTRNSTAGNFYGPLRGLPMVHNENNIFVLIFNFLSGQGTGWAPIGIDLHRFPIAIRYFRRTPVYLLI